MSDSEILGLLRQGRLEEAFTQLVNNYSERLYWHVRTIVGTHEDADAVVQDAFLKIWNALPSWRGEAQIYTWVYRIATNEALNFLRKEKVRSALRFRSLDEEMERRIDGDPYFNGSALERALSKEIAKLPEKQRLVFNLKYFDEMKYEDMSEMLGTSIGALKASYHHAVRKITEFFKAYD